MSIANGTTHTTAPHTVDKNERSRPIPKALQPSDESLKAIDNMITRTTNFMLQTVAEIDDIDHPIERSIAATALMDSLMQVLAEAKDVRRDAVKDAYEQGRSVSGWYGYAALGSQIGLSASRVRQILFDISTTRSGGHEIRDNEADEIRDTADARRAAIKMVKAGETVAAIVGATGLDEKDVVNISRAIHEV